MYSNIKPDSKTNLKQGKGVFEMSWLKSMVEKEPSEPENPIGTVVIGNIEPDMHDTARALNE